MQSAYDRDDYVTIKWDNITPGRERNFKKYSSNKVTHFSTTYDYDWVMHYGAFGFSKNGKPTVVPKVSDFYFVQRQKFLHENLFSISVENDFR